MSATWVLCRLAWTRLARGRAPWLLLLLALLPPVVTLIALGHASAEKSFQAAAVLTLRLLVGLAAALLIAPAIGEEIEQGTLSYLWSRPVPRSALLLGKLCAFAPVIVLLLAPALTCAWLLANAGGAGTVEVGVLARTLAALVAGAIGFAAFVGAAAAIFPRHPFPFVLGWVLGGEQLLSVLPMVQNLSVASHALHLAGFARRGPPPSAWEAAAWLVALTVSFLVVGLVRVTRAEYLRAEG